MKAHVESSSGEATVGATGTREFEQLLAQRVGPETAPRRERIDAVLVGTLVGFRAPHEPLVIHPGQRSPAALTARTSVDLTADHIGHEVTLVFEDGNPERPIVTGRIRVPAAWPTPDPPSQVEVDADGNRLTLVARERLVLRCGDASITLTAAGKVLIHGTYVSSGASGVNRVTGGSVQIN